MLTLRPTYLPINCTIHYYYQARIHTSTQSLESSKIVVRERSNLLNFPKDRAGRFASCLTVLAKHTRRKRRKQKQGKTLWNIAKSRYDVWAVYSTLQTEIKIHNLFLPTSRRVAFSSCRLCELFVETTHCFRPASFAWREENVMSR